MQKIRLGIIGLSEGNGHPYSWSAIFNGYDPAVMKDCPFPVIPKYLAKQQFPEDSIKEGCVTHIWTQDKSVSKHVAEAANIENIVDNYTDLIGHVDAVLLARDDAELHYEMSAPFLKAGLPIYIDKPLAPNLNTAEKIYALQKYDGQIFTCSALSYAKEFKLDEENLNQLGNIKYIDACVMKSWEKYGIHIVEPVLKLIGDQGKLLDVQNLGSGGRNIVVVTWQSGLQATFSVLGDATCPIAIRIFGANGFLSQVFQDTFYAFKKALKTFVNIILKKQNPPSKEFVLRAIDLIERGKLMT
jgi:hypothetical protein